MKKLFLILAFVFLALMSHAQYETQATNDVEENLYVYLKEASNAVVYSLDNLDKLTFGDNAISIWYDGGRTDYQYSRISVMTFREDIKPTTSIEPLSFVAADVKITFERSSSLVRVESGCPLLGVDIYDVQGR